VRIAALVIAAVAAQPARPQQPRPTRPPGVAPGWSAYVQAFDAYVAGDSIVGGATLVMRDGRVLARHEVGYGDRALDQRVDSNTIFHWASITKTLTAIAVMQLVERGRLSLDARVTDFIPELRLIHSAWGTTDSITVGMLLSHSSGLQDATWPWKQGKPWEPFEPTTWDQLVAMMPYQEVAFQPGSRFSYSNPGFIYLAKIVEQLTGDPWEAYIQKNIFTPLGLTRSYFNTTPYHLARFRSNNYTVGKDSSTGRVRIVANGRDFNPGITVPNGGWNAPLGDLVRYAAFLTDAADVEVSARGEPALQGPQATRQRYETVLPHRTLERMWRPRYATDSGSKAWMGLSFFSLVEDGVRIVGHTGYQAGFRSFIYWNPTSKGAVIAAFNTDNAAEPERSDSGFVRLAGTARALLR
jgi:CubicO group peptidase (beta-lactamase class C family)